MLTGNGLSEYARVHLGTPYFYGAKIPEGALTERKMSTMHAMYPKVVTTNYMAKARRKGQVGKVNVDCSGLIAGYRQLNIGSYPPTPGCRLQRSMILRRGLSFGNPGT